MPVLAADDARQHELPGLRCTTLASPSTGATETSVWRLALTPAADPVPHRLTREEVFVVTGGRASVSLDGRRAAVAPGDTLVVPAGVELVLEAEGPEAFEAIVCLPVGGQGVIGDGPAFTPPWAE